MKKSGLFAAAGLLPASFTGITAANRSFNKRTTAENSFAITNAAIITMDDELGEFDKADILIQNGEIVQIGKSLSVPSGVEIINGEGFLVMPGLIDCHRHMWTSILRSMAGDKKSEGYFPMTTRYSSLYTPEDMEIATRYAAVEAINAGITTVIDYNHNARNPKYVMASCNALSETGIRAQVLYGNYRDKKDAASTPFEEIQDVQKILQNEEKFKLLKLGLGSRGATYDQLKNDWDKAREMGLGISIHASSNASQKGQIMTLSKKGLLGRDVNIIHANAITPEEIEVVKQAEATITMTPFSEMRIGYGFPKINVLHEAGINLTLGVDTVALAGNADMFSLMKLIQNLANATAKNEFYIEPGEVIKIATLNGAKILGLENITGSLTPGKRADLIMLKRNDLNFSSGSKIKHLAVEAAQPQNVDFVAVDGKILKRNGKLTQIDVEEIISTAVASFERMHREINS